MSEENREFPVLPLRDVVVYPHMVIPLFVGRQKSIAALEHAMETGKQILLVAQKNAANNEPLLDDIYSIGTVSNILQLLKLPDGTIKVLVEGIKRGAYFVSRREENLNTTHYFCRATNQKFNYTNNPTFFTASDGTLTVSSFDSDPHTYITTVGLYNDNNELLAVAKLSTPIQKSFSREAIIKVKLDY